MQNEFWNFGNLRLFFWYPHTPRPLEPLWLRQSQANLRRISLHGSSCRFKILPKVSKMADIKCSFKQGCRRRLGSDNPDTMIECAFASTGGLLLLTTLSVFSFIQSEDYSSLKVILFLCSLFSGCLYKSISFCLISGYMLSMIIKIVWLMIHLAKTIYHFYQCNTSTS